MARFHAGRETQSRLQAWWRGRDSPIKGLGSIITPSLVKQPAARHVIRLSSLHSSLHLSAYRGGGRVTPAEVPLSSHSARARPITPNLWIRGRRLGWARSFPFQFAPSPRGKGRSLSLSLSACFPEFVRNFVLEDLNNIPRSIVVAGDVIGIRVWAQHEREGREEAGVASVAPP